MLSREPVPAGIVPHIRYTATDLELNLSGVGARPVLRHLGAGFRRGSGRGNWITAPRWLPGICALVERLGGDIEPAKGPAGHEEPLVVQVERVSAATIRLHGHAANRSLFDLDVRRMRDRPGVWQIPATEWDSVRVHLENRGVVVEEWSR